MAAILDLFKLGSIPYLDSIRLLICYLMFISETCSCGVNDVAIGDGPFCISIISAPHNMGVDILFVQLSSLLTEI